VEVFGFFVTGPSGSVTLRIAIAVLSTIAYPQRDNNRGSEEYFIIICKCIPLLASSFDLPVILRRDKLK
jgi:hypothetical protein